MKVWTCECGTRNDYLAACCWHCGRANPARGKQEPIEEAELARLWARYQAAADEATLALIPAVRRS